MQKSLGQAGILTQKDQEEIQRIGKAVGDDAYG